MMIEVKNLSFSYGKRKQKVFNDFSLTLDKGSVYGLLGKNGTGKSTLLYLMTGLLRPQGGKVLYKGIGVALSFDIAGYVFGARGICITIRQPETICKAECSLLSSFQQ